MPENSENKRLISMDFLRILSFAVVFLFHFLTDRKMAGVPLNATLTFGNFASPYVAVGIFFILSGFGLTLSSERKPLKIKEFYLRRLTKIMIPIYVIEILYFVFKLLMNGYPFAAGIPTWKLIYNVLGISSYLTYHGVQCFDFGVGEWFIGALLLMYLLFPLLQKAVQKWNHKFMILLFLAYVCIVLFVPFKDAEYTYFSVKIFDFVLGIWLAKNREIIKNKFIKIPALFILLVSFLPLNIPVKTEYWVTLDAISILILFYHAEGLLQKIPDGAVLKIQKLSALEYPMFLLHHLVINEIGCRMILLGTKKEMLFLCILEMLVTFVLGWILDGMISGVSKKRTLKPQKVMIE